MRLLVTLVVLGAIAIGALSIRPGTRAGGQAVPAVSSQARGDAQQASRSGHIFRWRDAGGSIVISDSPPPPGVDAERLDYRYDAPSPTVAGGTTRRDPTTTPPGAGDGATSPLREQLGKTQQQLRQRDALMDELRKKL